MKKKKSSRAEEVLSTRMVGGKFSELATYSDLFQRTNDGIFLVDLDTHQILECNPSAERLTGIRAAELERQDFHTWFDTTSQAALQKILHDQGKNGSAHTALDVTLRQKSGEERILALTAGRLRLADYCEVIQVIAKDVSEERRAFAELHAANRQLTVLSTTDEMTKLFNFRYFMTELEKEHERAKRYKHSYSVILCDVDHFKNFNDKNGHTEGDEALRHVARILERRARKTDVVARYGGEEFVVLCPQMSSEQAKGLAEGLREAVASEKFRHGEKQPLGRVSISVGLAHFPAHGESAGEIITHADAALYASKAGGRNRVSVYEASTPLPKKKSA